MLHLHNRRRPDHPYGLFWTWCGRNTRSFKVTSELPKVTCDKCREGFASYLRSLPDVLPVSEGDPDEAK